MKKIYIPLALVSFVGLVTITSYNTIQSHDVSVHRAWSNLDATLQRRSDLIPNLVETVKAYAHHEQETFIQVTLARQKIASLSIDDEHNSPNEMQQYAQAQQDLSQSLHKMMLIVENYPELKSDQSFRSLQHQLEGTENRINVARQDLNMQVAVFNQSLKTFPNNIVNNVFLHMSPKTGFKAAPYADTVPTVSFN
ncbi:MAG: LemA family protein [Gammaproteobacteria bacterium]|nr:LemA family protein [Gammaproteobacteria bacterium]